MGTTALSCFDAKTLHALRFVMLRNARCAKYVRTMMHCRVPEKFCRCLITLMAMVLIVDFGSTDHFGNLSIGVSALKIVLLLLQRSQDQLMGKLIGNLKV
ncbi:hypothetical protein D3C74_405530 [compost metagenome]